MRPACVPVGLRVKPFRGADAVSRGVLTRAQIRGSAWRRLYRDVYVSRLAVVDHLTWCQAAALLLPAGGAVSGRSAAYLYGANVMPTDAAVEITVPHRARLAARAGLVIRRGRLDSDEVGRRSGLPVTVPVRTAVDLVCGPDVTEAVVGLDALLYRRVVTPAAVERYLAARPGWPGTARARQALRLIVPGAESPMETRLRLLIVAGGLPAPTVQHVVRDRAGRFVARVDLAYPALRVGIEYDGDHHRERETFRRDAARLNALRLCGWTVLRFTADDVLRRPDRVVAQVRAVLRGFQDHGSVNAVIRPE